MARQTIEGYITSSRLPKGIFPMQTDNPARAGSKEDEAFAHQEIKYPWINHSLLGGNYGRGRL
jgi:hypothetical protein